MFSGLVLFFILMLKISHVWPAGRWLLCPFDRSPSLLEHFLVFWLCEMLILYFLCLNPGISYISQGHLVLFSWEWHLGTKIWALGIIPIFKEFGFLFRGKEGWSYTTVNQILFVGSVGMWAMTACKSCWVLGTDMGGRFWREETWVYLWLILVDVWQKATKFCKTIILQLRKLSGKKVAEYWCLLKASCSLRCGTTETHGKKQNWRWVAMRLAWKSWKNSSFHNYGFHLGRNYCVPGGGLGALQHYLSSPQ